GPVEFRYNGTMVQDYVPIEWPDGRIKWYYDNIPGLYDDLYMDLTFVDIFDRLGLDAPVDSFAMSFANAGYTLWHANQSARYNILHGIKPPQSGHWLNNPHADDIDYQIEADYAGLMSPGMPNAASEFSDKIGHIMNYGDGWYGGVYVGAMYSVAFVSNDIETVVSEALKTIPHQSKFYQCMSDVIKWHKQFPNDWKRTWFECEKKWSSETGCPDGVFVPLDIDALMNSAYVTIGLLYGQGDFFKTIDIATRCGQDADCNPSTAAGILGTMIGYSRIPEKWKKNLYEVENINFAYTDISLNKAYKMSFDHALKVIARNGGKISGDNVTLVYQKPIPVRYEKAFDGLYPIEKIEVQKTISKQPEITFEGTGIVFKGHVQCSDPEYVAKAEMYIDGKLTKTADLPAKYQVRSNDLFWKYQLPKGKHTVSFKWLNPQDNASVNFGDAIVYSDAPKKALY
ncbi:MAG: ADP-ribosylglycohydrolase family protein, partial [Bacteroidota bacterium]|nr:ADP-ribosylglycohydrolase family protein [Bacteroidota bacterium]